MKLIYCILMAGLALAGCRRDLEDSSAATGRHNADSVAKHVAQEYSDEYELKETKIIFPSYSIIFHGFDIDNEDGYGFEMQDFEVSLRQDGKINALAALKDSVWISEYPGGYFNDLLMEIVPDHKGDTFKISVHYMTALNETFNNREMSQEEVSEAYKRSAAYKEHTEEVELVAESALTFRMPGADNQMLASGEFRGGTLRAAATKGISERIRNEERLYKKEMQRIKHKYGLKDTLVAIDGRDSEEYVTLGSNGRLFFYNYDCYVIKTERYHNGKLEETNYIIAAISYGC